MSRASSQTELERLAKQAGDGDRAKLVFAYRPFELAPTGRKQAERLLGLLPKERDDTWTVALTMGNLICEAETDKDMRLLAGVGEGLGLQLARAVQIAPSFMDAYVRYSFTATGDPHSDYAERMHAVCTRMHTRFIQSVKSLPTEDRKWLDTHIIESGSCKVLAMSEGDGG